MTSVGNDIVDLALTDRSRSPLPRFYTKILSPAEIARFDGGDFHQYLWRCWSVKESAYKYIRRHQPGLRFSPTRIEVDGDTVHIAGVTLYARSWITDVIVTIVGDEPGGGSLLHETLILQGDPSQTVRERALDRLCACYPGRGWTITTGCPTAVCEDLRLPLSFSHHGAFIGYVIAAKPLTSVHS